MSKRIALELIYRKTINFMVFQPTNKNRVDRVVKPPIGTLGYMISNCQAVDPPPIILSIAHTGKKEIINAVEETFGVSIADMRGRIRKREIVIARMCLAYLLRNRLGYTLKQCAEVLNKDHTSIIHYLHDIRINWRNQNWWHYIEKTEEKL